MERDEAYQFCFEAVKRGDKEHFVAGLFAAEERRKHLYALYAFHLDLQRICRVVTDPFPGEIRLQWWRDAIGGVCHGKVEAFPVAAAFLDTVEACDLPKDALLGMIEAHSLDLYHEPVPTIVDLECAVCDIEAGLIQLAARILGGRCRDEVDEVAEHAGIALGLTNMMRALPSNAACKQPCLPDDLIERNQLDCQTMFAGKTTPELRAALAELRGRVRAHLDKARARIACLPAEVAPAFLTASLVEHYLRLMERDDYDPLTSRIEIPLWRRHWILWRAAARVRRHYEQARKSH